MTTAERLHLPYPAYLRFIAWRSGVIWLLVRVALFLMVLFVSGFVPTSFLDALRQPSYGLPAILVWLDRRFFHEILLSANLGGWEGWIWVVSLAVSLGLDLLAAAILPS